MGIPPHGQNMDFLGGLCPGLTLQVRLLNKSTTCLLTSHIFVSQSLQVRANWGPIRSEPAANTVFRTPHACTRTYMHTYTQHSTYSRSTGATQAVQDTLEGHHEFRHKPPTGYRAVAEWIMENHPGRSKKQRAAPPPPPILMRSLSQQVDPYEAVVRLRVCSGWQTATLLATETDGDCANESFSATGLYPSAVADRVVLAPGSGVWYYEAAISALERAETDIDGRSKQCKCSIGFATRRFFGNYIEGLGVGDDDQSWGFVLAAAEKEDKNKVGKDELSLKHAGVKVQISATIPGTSTTNRKGEIAAAAGKPSTATDANKIETATASVKTSESESAKTSNNGPNASQKKQLTGLKQDDVVGCLLDARVS